VNKRLIIFVILIAAFVLSAINPWPSVLTIWNWTGSNVYLRLTYRGEQKYFLTATPEGNSDTYRKSNFDIVRRQYVAEVTACETMTRWARMNLAVNLRLNFTPCESMKQWWTPKYWGEPTQEKPNFFTSGTYTQHVPENDPQYGDIYWARRFKFLYDIQPGLCWNDDRVGKDTFAGTSLFYGYEYCQ
jgi:hypothetical protein